MRSQLLVALIFSVVAATATLAAPGGPKENNGNGQEKSEPAPAEKASAAPNPPADTGKGKEKSEPEPGPKNNGSEPKNKPVEGASPKPRPVDKKPGPEAAGGSSDHVQVVPLDQDEAIDAVKRGRALPLEDIIKIAERSSGVDVIDAKLMHVQGILVYRLTVIADSGLTKRVFYYARSGNPIRFN